MKALIVDPNHELRGATGKKKATVTMIILDQIDQNTTMGGSIPIELEARALQAVRTK